MGLDASLSSAVQSLKVAQEAMSVSSQNIANVSTPGYTRRIVEQVSQNIDGTGNVVDIKSISRKVDDFLLAAVRNQTSSVNHAETLDEYYKRIQVIFGKPNTPTNLTSAVNEAFKSLSSLATSPELSSLKVDAVNKLNNLSDMMSGLARGIYQLRYDADFDIETSVNAINKEINTLYDLNINLQRTSKLNMDRSNLEEQRDASLKRLAEHIDIYVYYRDDGRVVVNTGNGKGLLDDNKYLVEYTHSSSIDSFIENTNMNSLTVTIIDQNGQKGYKEELVTSGKGEQEGVPSTVVNYFKSGRIKALQEMRDNTLPLILDQLDTISATITNEFNKLHNQGGGYPPAAVLKSTRPLSANDLRKFSGQVKMALVDPKGEPLMRPDGTLLNPLTLDLAKLNDNNGIGTVSVQTIINEINQYFFTDQINPRFELGNLYDVKMVASDNLSTSPNGQFSFDFELNNESQQNSSFEILSVNVTDAGATGLVSALPPSCNIPAGQRSRTRLPMTVDFSGGGGGPYTVQVAMKVTSQDGTVTNSTVNYVIDDNPGTLNVINKRYQADSIALGAGQIVQSKNLQGFAQASLVNDNDSIVPNGFDGYLKLQTLNKDYRIVIDDLTSEELGHAHNIPSMSTPATNRGFSHFFELNNFFKRNPEQMQGRSDSRVANTALNMAVREDILNDPNLISIGKLTRSPSYEISQEVGLEKANATVQFDVNPQAGDTITIYGKSFTFVAAASAPNEINVGASLSNTLNNMVATFNDYNSFTAGFVDKTTSSSNGSNTLTITFNTPGVQGNGIPLSGNFATANIVLNNSLPTNTPSGVFINGSSSTENVTINPWSNALGVGNKVLGEKLANLINTKFSFDASGGLTSTDETIIGYIGNILSYNTTNALNVEMNLEKEQSFYDSYNTKLEQGSGVNMDQELADIIKLQNTYAASARVINVTRQLFDTLLEAFR